MIKVITDSTADLSPAIAAELGIAVAPVHVHFGSEVYRDGVDISTDEIYRRLDNAPVYPTTSQPNPEEMLAFYREIGKGADGIISVHISSEISGTVNSARLAAAEYDGCPVEVVDSRFNSVGLGLVAQASARLAGKGAAMADVLAETRAAIAQVDMLGIFDTLKYVYRGGRIGRAKFTLSSIIGIKPLLDFRDGRLHQAGVVRSYPAGMARMENFVKRNLPVRELAIAHSAVPEKAALLKQRLAVLAAGVDIQIHQLGAALGVHGGPGVLLVGLRRTAD